MIGIKVNGVFLKMPAGARAALEFNNPLFDEELITGDFALPFEVPYFPNAKLFDFAWHTLNIAKPHSIEGAALYFKGQRICPAIIDILQISRDTVSCSLRLNMSSLPVMRTRLRDIDLGNIHFGDTPDDVVDYATVHANDLYPTANFCFPMIRNTQFYDLKNEDFLGWMNFYDQGTGYKMNSDANYNTLVPMVYLFHVLKTGFAVNGYTLDMATGFMADAVENKLTIYNNYAIDRKEKLDIASSFRATCNTGQTVSHNSVTTILFNNDSTGGFYDESGYYDNTTGEYTIPAADTYKVYVSLDLNILYDLSQLYGHVGRSDIYIQLRVDGVVVKSTLYQERYPTTTIFNRGFTFSLEADAGMIGSKVKVTVLYLDEKANGKQLQVTGYNEFSVDGFTAGLNVFKTDIVLRDYVPDITFGTLLNALRLTKNLDIRINHVNKTAVIDYFDNVVDASLYPAKVHTKKGIPGHRILVPGPGRYKNFNYTWASDDELVNENFKPYNKKNLLGSFKHPNHLIALFPPTEDYKEYFAIIENVNQVWACQPTEDDPDVYEWVYFTDNWFDEVVLDDGDIEVRPACSTLLMEYNDLAGAIWPRISQKGSSDEFGLGRNEYSLRLFYYWGVGAYIPGMDAPFASSVNYNAFGVKLSDTSMMWHTYLITLWQHRVALYFKNEWYEKKIKLNLAELLGHNIGQIQRIEQGYFMPKQMRIGLGSEVEESTYTCLQL